MPPIAGVRFCFVRYAAYRHDGRALSISPHFWYADDCATGAEFI